MAKKIKLTRDRNVTLRRYKAGEILEVGNHLALGQAETLVRVGAAKWHKTAKKANKD